MMNLSEDNDENDEIEYFKFDISKEESICQNPTHVKQMI